MSEWKCRGPISMQNGRDFCVGCGCRIPPRDGEAYCRDFGDYLGQNNNNNERQEDSSSSNQGT